VLRLRLGESEGDGRPATLRSGREKLAIKGVVAPPSGFSDTGGDRSEESSGKAAVAAPALGLAMGPGSCVSDGRRLLNR
jgi:hypothetical protein